MFLDICTRKKLSRIESDGHASLPDLPARKGRLLVIVSLHQQEGCIGRQGLKEGGSRSIPSRAGAFKWTEKNLHLIFGSPLNSPKRKAALKSE